MVLALLWKGERRIRPQFGKREDLGLTVEEDNLGVAVEG